MGEVGYLNIFEKAEIKPTSVRILVLKAMQKFNNTFSLRDLEDELQTVDKSTIFRTITLFLEHHLIHGLEDGSGSMKYCLCQNNGECTVEELHCHFSCNKCGKTYCLDESAVPVAEIPTGFIVQSINYLLKGTCPKCNKIK